MSTVPNQWDALVNVAFTHARHVDEQARYIRYAHRWRFLCADNQNAGATFIHIDIDAQGFPACMLWDCGNGPASFSAEVQREESCESSRGFLVKLLGVASEDGSPSTSSAIWRRGSAESCRFDANRLLPIRHTALHAAAKLASVWINV